MNQKCSGEFSVSVSKVMPVGLTALFQAAAANAKPWFPKGSFVESSRTENRYWRGAWGKTGARLEVNFYEKSPGKAQIVVQVNKLADGGVIESERTAWKAALARLEARLAASRKS